MGLVDLEGVRQQSSFTPNASPLVRPRLLFRLRSSLVLQPTGRESIVEKWLYHKLNLASASVSVHLEERDFSDASTAAYQFFLYDLCDVFIEATKPLFETNVESPSKVSAQNTLYTCLEGGLKLLHPFMPYVTEDLWQRLPRRPDDKCESIMVSSFPEKASPP
jgi:valyl-tRNA synthetase